MDDSEYFFFKKFLGRSLLKVFFLSYECPTKLSFFVV